MEVIETERLLLRRPRAGDAPAIFSRYASDPEVTRFLAWPTHRTEEETRAFVAVSDEQWSRWPGGPLLVFVRDGNLLIGGAGVMFQTAERAITGYVLARDAWGRGFATEALLASVGQARAAGVRRLEASVHAAHAASIRVLEKAGFVRQRQRPGRASDFPNLPPGDPRDVFEYALTF